MGAMSDYLEVKILEHVLKHVAYTSPTTVYLALFTVAPTDSTSGTEVTGGSYARQAETFGSAVSPGGTIANSAAVNYTNLPACTIVGGAVMDALTSGNVLFYGALNTPRTVTAGDNLTVAIGDHTVSVD